MSKHTKGPCSFEEHRNLVEIVKRLLETKWAKETCEEPSLCDFIAQLDDQVAESEKAIAKAEGRA